MIHLPQDTSFIFEGSREAEITGKAFGKHSRRQLAVPRPIVGTVHFAHPTCAQSPKDFALTIEYGHALSPTWN